MGCGPLFCPLHEKSKVLACPSWAHGAHIIEKLNLIWAALSGKFADIRALTQDCSDKQNEVFNFFRPGFWPNPGPGRRPLDSGRRDIEIAGVFASVATMAVSFVCECIFWKPRRAKSFKGCPSNGGINQKQIRMGWP